MVRENQTSELQKMRYKKPGNKPIETAGQISETFEDCGLSELMRLVVSMDYPILNSFLQ